MKKQFTAIILVLCILCLPACRVRLPEKSENTKKTQPAATGENGEVTKTTEDPRRGDGSTGDSSPRPSYF
jgi:hypothetical protein